MKTAVLMLVFAGMAAAQMAPPPGNAVQNFSESYSTDGSGGVMGNVSFDTNGCHSFGILIEAKGFINGQATTFTEVYTTTANSGQLGGHISIDFAGLLPQSQGGWVVKCVVSWEGAGVFNSPGKGVG